MTPPSAGDARAVIQARTLTALGVINRVLEFADPSSPLANDPHAWGQVSSELKYLEMEVMHTAVMRMSGVPWEVLASGQNVPRQALHRRLAKKVSLQTMDAIEGQPKERIVELLDDILATVSAIRTNVESDSLKAADKVVERSKSSRWWDTQRRG